MGIDVAVPTETLSRLRSKRNVNHEHPSPTDSHRHISRVSRVDLEQQETRTRQTIQERHTRHRPSLDDDKIGSGKSINSEPIYTEKPERGIETSNSF